MESSPTTSRKDLSIYDWLNELENMILVRFYTPKRQLAKHIATTRQFYSQKTNGNRGCRFLNSDKCMSLLIWLAKAREIYFVNPAASTFTVNLRVVFFMIMMNRDEIYSTSSVVYFTGNY